MDTSRDIIRQKIAELAKTVIPKGGHLWLYGSQARGDFHNDSDWDLLILLDKEKITSDDHDNCGYPFRELGWNLDATISPILYTLSDWEKYSFTPFYKNVEQDKIVIL